MKKDLICIVCPRGCSLTVSDESGAWTVTGNTCPRGEAYGIAETTHPTRTVTSVVRVENRKDVMLSVKTEEPIPKEHIFDLMRRLRAVSVPAPVAMGQVVLDDVYGTRVVATREVK